jgi:hypothetical protein
VSWVDRWRTKVMLVTEWRNACPAAAKTWEASVSIRSLCESSAKSWWSQCEGTYEVLCEALAKPTTKPTPHALNSVSRRIERSHNLSFRQAVHRFMSPTTGITKGWASWTHQSWSVKTSTLSVETWRPRLQRRAAITITRNASLREPDDRG